MKDMTKNVKPKSAQDKTRSVRERNAFYADGSGKMLFLAGISIVCLIFSIISAISIIQYKAEPAYFAVDKNGALIKLVRLDEPNQKDSAVASWLSQAIVDTFSFNFTDINYRLNESTMKWFTSAGKDKFLQELNSSGYKDVVIDEKLILSSVLPHTPVLLKSGVRRETGIYSWMFQTEAVISFRTQTKQYSRKVLFTVTIERVSVMDNIDGLGISSIVMQNTK